MGLFSRAQRRRVKGESTLPATVVRAPVEESAAHTDSVPPPAGVPGQVVGSDPGDRRSTFAQLVDQRIQELFPTDPSALSPEAGRSARNGAGAVRARTPANGSAIASASESASAAQDHAQPIQMFAEITRGYIAPVQRFVAHLRRGPYPARGLDLHRPAMEMVSRAAERLAIENLVPRINRFTASLRGAAESGEASVDGTLRQRILDAYAVLEQSLPEAFRIDAQAAPADDIILLSLLRQIGGVGTVTLDKIFRAGLTSVEMFEQATPRDLAVTSGISESLATRICVRVHGYLVARRAIASTSDYANQVALLAALTGELRTLHEAYESKRRSDEPRWTQRRRRLDVALQIDLCLAELGERDFVDELHKMPYTRRLERLHRYVESIGGTVPPRNAK